MTKQIKIGTQIKMPKGLPYAGCYATVHKIDEATGICVMTHTRYRMGGTVKKVFEVSIADLTA